MAQHLMPCLSTLQPAEPAALQTELAAAIY
jgi:hypothetical protein